MVKILVVITGPASSGKTTTLKEIKKKLSDDNRFGFIEESASKYIGEEQLHGRDPFIDMEVFQKNVVPLQILAEQNAFESTNVCTFSDRCLLDNVAISGITNGVDHEITRNLKTIVIERQYRIVFFLSRRPLVKSIGRSEQSEDEVEKQYIALLDTYSYYQKIMNYTLIFIPLVEIEKRCELIIDYTMQALKKLERDESSISALLQIKQFVPEHPRDGNPLGTEPTPP